MAKVCVEKGERWVAIGGTLDWWGPKAKKVGQGRPVMFIGGGKSVEKVKKGNVAADNQDKQKPAPNNTGGGGKGVRWGIESPLVGSSLLREAGHTGGNNNGASHQSDPTETV